MGNSTTSVEEPDSHKKGYTYSVIVTTDFDSDILSIVSDYDARGGIPESNFCQDSQGLSNTLYSLLSGAENETQAFILGTRDADAVHYTI